MHTFTVQFDEYPLFQGKLGNGGWLNGEMLIEADEYDWGIAKVLAYVGPNERITEIVPGDLAQKITDWFMAREGWVNMVDERHREEFSADEVEARRSDFAWMERV